MQPQFRGIFIPARIMQLFWDKRLNAQEVLLLATIDSLVKVGEGTTVSNRELAALLALSIDQTRRYIRLLIVKGFLHREICEGERVLHVGPAYRNEPDTPLCKNAHPPVQKCTPPCAEMHTLTEPKHRETEECIHSSGVKSVNSNNIYNINKGVNNICRRFDKPSSGTKVKVKVKDENHRSRRWKKFATRLAEVISQRRKVNYRSKTTSWANSFRLLHTRDGVDVPRIRKVLDWYCENYGRGGYIPVAESGAAFREKFLRIESAMARSMFLGNGEHIDDPRYQRW